MINITSILNELLCRRHNIMASTFALDDIHPSFHIIWDKKLYSEAVGLACKIVSTFPNTHFVGIGNSPSYIIYGIDALSKQEDLSLATTYVRFRVGI